MTPPRPFPLDCFGPFASRPRLLGAFALGLAAGATFAAIPSPLDTPTRAILAWDIGCLAYVWTTLSHVARRDAPFIRGAAARQDEGQGMILGLVLALSAASLAAVAVELSFAKDAHGFDKALRVALAFGSVSVSWFVTQLIFALHYAHEYYAPDDDDDPATLQQGGLRFPDDDAPDYWDFIHFAVVIGAAAQTADVEFTSKRMRRIGTVHGLVAFTFNTVILALTINILAGLLS
jgi:uncharacterized membrane protein